MAQPARRPRVQDAPPVDPAAVARAYRRERARRRARIERRRESRRANLRFWVVLVVLLAGLVALTTVVLRQAHALFGL